MRDSCIIGVGQEYWISQTLGLKVCPHPYFLQFHYKECLEQEEIIFSLLDVRLFLGKCILGYILLHIGLPPDMSG